jgi:hypothetical protein
VRTAAHLGALADGTPNEVYDADLTERPARLVGPWVRNHSRPWWCWWPPR